MDEKFSADLPSEAAKSHMSQESKQQSTPPLVVSGEFLGAPAESLSSSLERNVLETKLDSRVELSHIGPMPIECNALDAENELADHASSDFPPPAALSLHKVFSNSFSIFYKETIDMNASSHANNLDGVVALEMRKPN